MIFYYDDDKHVYLTQLDAIQSKHRCYFYFDDKEFSKVDWLTEPKEHLDDLYVLRAKQLRDEYDYLILCFSGGTDSSHVLETFYHNNIHIDEIVTVGALSQDSSEENSENMNTLIKSNVIPRLKEYNIPKTKITVVDFSKYYNDPYQFSLVQKYGHDWPRYTGSYRSPYNLFWYDIKKLLGQENKKNTAVIMGSDKCKLEFINDRPGIVFSDLAFASLGGFTQDENYRRVNFYTDHTEIASKIIKKQAHMLLNIQNITADGYNKITSSELEFAKVFYNYRRLPLMINEKSRFSSLSGKDMFLVKNRNSDISSILNMSFSMMKTLGVDPKIKYEFKTKPHFIR